MGGGGGWRHGLDDESMDSETSRGRILPDIEPAIYSTVMHVIPYFFFLAQGVSSRKKTSQLRRRWLYHRTYYTVASFESYGILYTV